jgi:hypothetical protein
MKANHLLAGLLLIATFFSFGAYAVPTTSEGSAASHKFLFIENDTDDSYFVTPTDILDPRMSGSNKWSDIKCGANICTGQQSLGYIDDGHNHAVLSNYYLDIWLENASVKNPLTGLRCISFYNGCNADTSLILPQTTDEKGFYGVRVSPGDAKWAHGMMSPSFYQYLKQMSVGETMSMEINSCQTASAYDATKGERCKDQASGYWFKRTVSHTKAANLHLIDNNVLAEIFVNSDGIPIINSDNGQCKIMTIGSRNGVMCNMLSYQLQDSGISNTSIHIYPRIMHSALNSAVSNEDVQFSFNGNDWMTKNRYLNFNDLKGNNSIYIFFSSHFFKSMVSLGITDMSSNEVIGFMFDNSLISPESGWYTFRTSTNISVKPRDFGVSIVADDNENKPHRSGYVGRNEPPLQFGYTITTSGKTAADEVKIAVSGPTQGIDGINYCIFSSADSSVRVPFPAQVSVKGQSGQDMVFDAGCHGRWHDITNALWNSSPWEDVSGDIGVLNKTHLQFTIPMNATISTKTIQGEQWYGDVSADGEIKVEATWRNVN